MRWMTRCTCSCSGGPLGTTRAGFGGAACAGTPAQAKPLAFYQLHSFKWHHSSSSHFIVAPCQAVRMASDEHLTTKRLMTTSKHGRMLPEFAIAGMPCGLPGCFWASAAGSCLLSEACRAPFAGAAAAGAEGVVDACAASCTTEGDFTFHI